MKKNHNIISMLFWCLLIQLSVPLVAVGQDLIEQDSVEYIEYEDTEYVPLPDEALKQNDAPPLQESEFPKPDQTPVWNDDKWQEVKKNYTYDPDEEKEKEEEIKEKEDDLVIEEDEHSTGFLESLNEFFRTPLGKMLAIVVAATLLIILIVKLISGKPLGANKKIKVLQEIDLTNVEELPEEDALDMLLRLSLEKKDYKTAVRILYLKLIRQLSESKLIQWQKDKTNRDYLNEMRALTSYRSFRDLTLIYEVIWYGDQEIAGQDYQRVSDMFTQYQNNLNGNNQEN